MTAERLPSKKADVQLRLGNPIRLSRGGGSFQLGRASAPTIPQRVHTMWGPNVGTATSFGHQHRLMVTVPARHVERPHAALAHVAECHRLDRLIEAGQRWSNLCRLELPDADATLVRR